jgi:hypothetical protein
MGCFFACTQAKVHRQWNKRLAEGVILMRLAVAFGMNDAYGSRVF